MSLFYASLKSKLFCVFTSLFQQASYSSRRYGPLEVLIYKIDLRINSSILRRICICFVNFILFLYLLYLNNIHFKHGSISKQNFTSKA